eukprot:7142383-Alexandrium_andersonii.AAC.1
MPFQFALSTRAGTDCVARVVRSLTELSPGATLVSIDAFDRMRRRAMHRMRRRAMLTGLRERPRFGSRLSALCFA